MGKYLFKSTPQLALPYADTVERLEALLPWNVKDKVASFKKQ